MSYIGKSPVPVVIGGTGDTTLTAHGVLVGEGTAAISATTAGTAGQVLLSGGASADPAYVAPTAGTGLSVTTNATTLSYALSTPVSVANGGTGATTLTANSLLLGNGTSAITALGVATNGQIPIGSTGSAPVLATITAGTGVTVTNGAGSITIAASGGAGVASLAGNSGSVSGSTVTLTTGASNANGTAKFTGSSTTMTLTFSDGSSNTGIGVNSLLGSSFSGSGNIGFGDSTGLALTSGQANIMVGYQAGKAITTGTENVFIGYQAGLASTATSVNTFLGYQSGKSLTGSTGATNTFLGTSTGSSITSGSTNALIGYNAGSSYTSSESSNICINANGTVGESNVTRIGAGTGTGTQQLNSAFICGITGIVVTGTAVLISTSNQLGVAVSSARFKEEILDMEDASDAIYKLRPVTFVWNQASAPGLAQVSQERQFGLIAEEVNEVLPQIVDRDEKGNPTGVNYDDLASLLINEIQKLSSYIADLEKKKGIVCHT